MTTIKVNLGVRSYEVMVGYNILEAAAEKIDALGIGGDAVVITNPAIQHLHGGLLRKVLRKKGFSASFLTVADSENSKSYKVSMDVINKLAVTDVKKRIFIIAFGGGVIGDLAGFVASVYKRGINYIQAPTTLLAQVDSAIGGKAAIDLPAAKNMIGSFYQPRLVVSDLSLLSTLSLKQIREGLAEIVKYAVIKNARLFEYVENNYRSLLRLKIPILEKVVSECAGIKAKIVQADERDDKGKRVILNFGHTAGHAIEAAAGYSREYSHGEAVAVGMVVASRIANRLKMLDAKSVKRIEGLIKRIGLPVGCQGLDIKDILNAQSRDKKFIHAKNRFVLPVAIGRVKVVEGVPEEIVESAISSCLK